MCGITICPGELQPQLGKSGKIAAMPILYSLADLNSKNIHCIYNNFDAPITALDCGQKCAPFNGGIPFCCDIKQAVPAVYVSEWEYFKINTNLWQPYKGEERAKLEADTPKSMTLLACQGHDHCQRNFRALSCRQFPFFPFVTTNYIFIGLAYEWNFENKCWIIDHLDQVTNEYRQQFVRTFDYLFSLFDDEFEAYAEKSAQARDYFCTQKHRIPILHRNGGNYLLSPRSERLQKLP